MFHPSIGLFVPSSRLVGFLVFQSRFYGPQHLRYSPDSIPGQQAGLPLAAGYSATLIALAGDLEYFNHSLSLPRWSSNTSCCPHCRATKQGAYSWTDFKSSAQWHDVIWTPQSWHLWDQRSPCNAGCLRRYLVCQGSMQRSTTCTSST